jgi:hypothetical protein
MKPEAKREGPLHIPVPFDDAIKRALAVKPPPEGWAKYEKRLKREKARAAKTAKRSQS